MKKMFIPQAVGSTSWFQNQTSPSLGSSSSSTYSMVHGSVSWVPGLTPAQHWKYPSYPETILCDNVIPGHGHTVEVISHLS